MSPGALGGIAIFQAIIPDHRIRNHQNMPSPNLWLQMARQMLGTTEIGEL